jgi:hypothetical protein
MTPKRAPGKLRSRGATPTARRWRLRRGEQYEFEVRSTFNSGHRRRHPAWRLLTQLRHLASMDLSTETT